MGESGLLLRYILLAGIFSWHHRKTDREHMATGENGGKWSKAERPISEPEAGEDVKDDKVFRGVVSTVEQAVGLLLSEERTTPRPGTSSFSTKKNNITLERLGQTLIGRMQGAWLWRFIVGKCPDGFSEILSHIHVHLSPGVRQMCRWACTTSAHDLWEITGQHRNTKRVETEHWCLDISKKEKRGLRNHTA